MLNRRRVLVVEDELLVALDLIAAIEDAEGEAIGPATTVEEALALLQTEDIQAAILDVQLADGDVTAVAQKLLDDGKPVLFHTASSLPDAILENYAGLAVCPKPTPSTSVIHRLVQILDQARGPPARTS